MLRCFQSLVLLIWFVECAGFRHIGHKFPLRRIPHSTSSLAPSKLHFLLGFDTDVPTMIANFVIGPASEWKDQVDLTGLATEPDFFQGMMGDARELAFLVAGITFVNTLSGDVENDSVVDAANAEIAPASCPQCQGTGGFFGGKCDVCSGTGKIDYNNPSFQLPGATRHAKEDDSRVIIDSDEDDEDDIDPTKGRGFFAAIFADDDDDDDYDNNEDIQIMSKVQKYEVDDEKQEPDNINSSNDQQQKKKQDKWLDNDEV